jgi:hypothetical protein
VYGKAGRTPPKVAGCDVTARGTGYMTTWLNSGAKNSIDAVTFHIYPLSSSRCKKTSTPSMAVNAVAAIDAWKTQSDSVKQAVASTKPPSNVEIWLGETALSVCGGQTGVDDSYPIVPSYLSSLGQLAQNGIRFYMHQTILGSDYGLVGW